MYDRQLRSQPAFVEAWPPPPTLTGLPSARAFATALEWQAALGRRYDRPGA